jgi:beta-N-acetylhexosaminidase
MPRFDSWSDSVLSNLSLSEKVGQLIMPWVLGDFAPDGSVSRERIRAMVEDVGVGGVLMSIGTPSDVAVKINDLQTSAEVPLLVAADLERGAGFRFRGAVYLPGATQLGGATEFPSLMALGATGDSALAYEMGRVTGTEARALGVHVPFAPVLDVNNNPDNPIINIRSFGEDPEQVAWLGRALARGIQDSGAIATGKHFPGHGDTETDSHLSLPVIPLPRERLDSVELLPFQSAIADGIGGIMTAHIAVPSLTDGERVPATLSPEILDGLLRGQMGFKGLVFTDAMDMYAIDRLVGRGEAAVRALEAGADVILMPPSPARAVEAVMEAVEEGRITEERIDQSVLRILKAKEDLRLHEDSQVPVQDILRTVGIAEHQAVAQDVADRSMTLLKNDRDLLPLLGTRTARVLSVSFRRPSDLLAGRFFNSGLRARYPRLVTVNLDQDTPVEVYRGIRSRARTSDLVVVSLYVTTVSYSGSVAIPEEVAEFIQDLDELGVPHVVVSFGNPYLLAEFPEVQAYLLAWSGAEVSQRAAVRALFGDMDIRGRTPTRIPPDFQIGDGIQLPAREGRRDY